MKTRTPADPAKLRELGRALQRVARRSEPLALHARLRFALLQCVHGGVWSAGDRLPTEADLVEATGLSLGTVQRTLRALTEEGVIERRQGSGSFVASAPHRIDDVAHCRFLGDDGRVLPVFSRVLGRKAAPARGPWAAHFAPGTRVLRLDRVLNVADEFDVYSRFYFDGERFAGLATRPLKELAGTNFKALLGQEAQLPPGGLSQTMRLLPASGEVARHLGVADGSLVAQFDAVRHIAGRGGTLYVLQLFVPPTARPLVTHESPDQPPQETP